MDNAVLALCGFVVREGWEQREDEGDYPRGLAQKALAEADSLRAEIARLNLRVAQLTSGSEAANLAGRVVEQDAEIERLKALLAEQTARAERAEALVERAEVAFHAAIARANQALAANAEMRAALEDALVSYEESGCVPMGPILDLARALLARPDLGGPDPRDAEIARLKGEVEKLREIDDMDILRAPDKWRAAMMYAEIARLTAERDALRVTADEAIVEHLVARKEVERLRRALAAGPAALRESAARRNPFPWNQPWHAYESAAVTVEVAQAAAMKEET